MSKRTALLGVVCAVAACVAALGAFAASKPNLASIALTPVDVGPGYKAKQRSMCITVGKENCSTMDFCGPYATEKERTGRLQLDYLATKTSPLISNEVVSYKTGFAQQAIDAARGQEPLCQGTVTDKSGAVTVRVRKLSRSGLLPGSLVERITFSGTVNGKHEFRAIDVVYQARHDVLCAVYGYQVPGVTAVATSRTTYHAAAKCTAHLKQFA